MNTSLNSFAFFNIGAGEIILVLVLLAVLTVIGLGFFALIYFIARAAQKRPGSAVPPAPPQLNLPNQQKRDEDHLNLLSVFHFILAGLGFLGLAFLALHYSIMQAVFSHPDAWNGQRNAPIPPKAFLDALVWFYVLAGVLLLAGMALNILSGIFLRQRRNRMFSFVVAGLDCLQIPFGTALGVFTILVLSRDSVRELYATLSHDSPKG